MGNFPDTSIDLNNGQRGNLRALAGIREFHLFLDVVIKRKSNF